MPATTTNHLSPREVLQLLRHNRRVWIIPAVILGLLAGVYALLAPETWEATQTLIIRNEASNNVEGPGKFRQLDDMKVTQDTILEIAKGREVLTKTLEEVGPPAERRETGPYPTAKEVYKLRDVIKLAPPKGAEFGKTEIFYLRVKDHSQDRAVALASALSRQIQLRYQFVLDQKAKSMIEELTHNEKVAEAGLNVASTQLADMEKQVGGDLAELRILHQNPSGDSDLRKKMVYLEGELNKLDQTTRRDRELLALLQDALQDPSHLVAAPNSLLEAQPALRRLKDGLVDAQLRTALLRGTMSEKHPQVAAAIQNEQAVRDQLHDELVVAVQAIEGDIDLNNGQAQSLQQDLAQLTNRLGRLAALRTEYSNLAAAVQTRSELLQVSQRRLAEARASENGAMQTSLINLLDTPDPGLKPVGPSKALIVLAGVLGGGLFGCGLLFLMYPGLPTPGTERAEQTEFTETDLLVRAAAAAVAAPTEHATATEDEPSLRQSLRKALSHRS